MENIYVRLPLKNASNVRDLGGLPTKDGRVTRFRTFLRADCLSGLDENDKKFLVDYGVKTCVDLRSFTEQRKYPSVFAESEDVKYLNIPLFGSGDTDDYIERDFGVLSLGHIYAKALDAFSDNIRRVFEAFGERLYTGTAVFNCFAGKDRTGITAALLLNLAGVGDQDIIANYEVSYANIRAQIPHVLKENPDTPLSIFRSEPEHMEHFLEHLNAAFGGAYGYLTDAGVDRALLDAIIGRFV